MTGRAYIDELYNQYYDDLVGPVLAARKALAELNPQTSAFVSLMKRQAKRELRHAIAFTKALLQYPELEHHERAEIAHQATDEYKHYALIKDYLKSRGADVEEVSVAAFDAYFDNFLAGDVRAFRLCNIAEESAVVFLRHLRDVSTDPAVKALADRIIADEDGHENQVRERLAIMAEDLSLRELIQKHFVQSWALQKEGVFLEATELGVDLSDLVNAKS